MSLQLSLRAQTPEARAVYFAPRPDDDVLLRNVREYTRGFAHDALRPLRGFDTTRFEGHEPVQTFEARLVADCKTVESDRNVRVKFLDYPACDLGPVVPALTSLVDALHIREYAVRVPRVAALYEFLMERRGASPPATLQVSGGRAVTSKRPLHRCALCNGPWVGDVSVALDLEHTTPYTEQHVFHLTCALFLRATRFPCCPCPALERSTAMCVSCFQRGTLTHASSGGMP